MIALKKLLAVLRPEACSMEAAPYESHLIEKLCYHSGEAGAGSMFYCLVGKTSDGHVYAPSAYRAGCRFFVVEHFVDLPGPALQICVSNARTALADSAAEFYGHPETKMRLIGLTGTKGKTTTAMLIRHLLCGAGIPTGYIGTNGVDFADEHIDTLNSTPESVQIYGYLRRMLDAGVRVCALEISSQALWMGRVRGLRFDTTLFTNLSRDHIGGVEHPDFEHYKRSKRRLFRDYATRGIVINRDDAASDYMLEELYVGDGGAASLLDFGLSHDCESGTPLWSARDMRAVREDDRIGVSFEAIHAGEVLSDRWFLPLPGDFNVRNALAALCVVCERFGVAVETARTLLADAVVPGRFETVVHPGMPDVTFVIDYAHNGVSLTSILEALRVYEPTRLIALFGSVGGRTKERRRDLAVAAGSRCDFCILTSDNPACEEPVTILQEIDAAFPAGSCPRRIIVDRAKAIREAVAIAEPGDVILLAGKGHETYQLIGTRRVPFCEREILWEALEARVGAGVP